MLGLASNHSPPKLCLLGCWDCRHKAPSLSSGSEQHRPEAQGCDYLICPFLCGGPAPGGMLLLGRAGLLLTEEGGWCFPECLFLPCDKLFILHFCARPQVPRMMSFWAFCRTLSGHLLLHLCFLAPVQELCGGYSTQAAVCWVLGAAPVFGQQCCWCCLVGVWQERGLGWSCAHHGRAMPWVHLCGPSPLGCWVGLGCRYGSRGFPWLWLLLPVLPSEPALPAQFSDRVVPVQRAVRPGLRGQHILRHHSQDLHHTRGL